MEEGKGRNVGRFCGLSGSKGNEESKKRSGNLTYGPPNHVQLFLGGRLSLNQLLPHLPKLPKKNKSTYTNFPFNLKSIVVKPSNIYLHYYQQQKNMGEDLHWLLVILVNMKMNI